MSAEDKLQISNELLTRLKNYMNDPAYKETVENSSSYNERLVKERKLRLPFIDAQTGVAQSDCYIWSSKLDRMPGCYSAQLYSYPARRWRKKRRQYLLAETNNSCNAVKDSEQTSEENSNSMSQDSAAMASTGSNNATIVPNGNCVSNTSSNLALNDTFEDSKDSWMMRMDDDESDLPDAGELDDPESDYDDYEEYSSRKKKSKRKESTKKKRTDYSDSEKPYVCECCGARYKTRPGLAYHFSHSHPESNGILPGNGIPEEELNFASPKLAPQASSSVPPSSNSNHSNHSNNSTNSQSQPSSQSNHLQHNLSKISFDSPEDKKDRKNFKIPHKSSRETNEIFCDFCLGDAEMNKKTNEPEELITCSDCNRAAHPSCLQFTERMLAAVKLYKWQCMECKSCGLCGTSDDDAQLLFCDDCDRGFHMYCLNPPLEEPPPGQWSCHLCIDTFKTELRQLKVETKQEDDP